MVVKLYSGLKRLTKYGALVAIIVLSVSLIQNITRMLESREEIQKAREELAELELQKSVIEKRYRQISSEDFVEKQARDRLGLAKEGEVVLVLPDETVVKSFAPRLDGLDSFELPDSIWKRWLNTFNIEI